MASLSFVSSRLWRALVGFSALKFSRAATRFPSASASGAQRRLESGVSYPQLVDRLIQAALARPTGLR